MCFHPQLQSLEATYDLDTHSHITSQNQDKGQTNRCLMKGLIIVTIGLELFFYFFFFCFFFFLLMTCSLTANKSELMEILRIINCLCHPKALHLHKENFRRI